MGQPVKLSDPLVLDARLAGDAAERSIAGQIEFWAQIGRGMERLLLTDRLVNLKRLGAVRPLSEVLDSIDTNEGRARVETFLSSRPFPHFAASGRPGLLVKIDEDGTRTLGRFVNRQFCAAK